MEIGDIVTELVPIGTGTNVMKSRRCKVLAKYDKKHLGVMYLLETIRGKFKTCVMVPPPPKFQPPEVSSKGKWSNPLAKIKDEDFEEERIIVDNYDEMLDYLHLDKCVLRSRTRLRSIANFNKITVMEDLKK